MKKKFFAPLMGAVVLGLSAYAGYRTYDAYNGVSCCWRMRRHWLIRGKVTVCGFPILEM